MTAPAPRTFNIVVLPGDGVGPEVALAAQRVLTCIGDIYGH
ncbi:MAG: 3-isopropylmalate dehydrogenase, partial [Proteobacteria bacterium]|nr:3-isopropylmalate dehydrogenase [Pseudomonadota bacterium]